MEALIGIDFTNLDWQKTASNCHSQKRLPINMKYP